MRKSYRKHKMVPKNMSKSFSLVQYEYLGIFNYNALYGHKVMKD